MVSYPLLVGGVSIPLIAVLNENLWIFSKENERRTKNVRRNAKMYTTKKELLATIHLMCLDCCLGQKKEVQLCPSTKCSLWPFRMGKDPDKKPRTITASQRAALEAGRKKLRH